MIGSGMGNHLFMVITSDGGVVAVLGAARTDRNDPRQPPLV